MPTVELRCPINPSRLFAKLAGERPKIVHPNLIEVACRDCRKAEDAVAVLHRFNVLGDLVETEVIR